MTDRIRLQKPTQRPTFRREWGCPRTKNRTPWCFGICTPENNYGECGRIAPHSLLGRTELAILHYKEMKAGEQKIGEKESAEGAEA